MTVVGPVAGLDVFPVSSVCPVRLLSGSVRRMRPGDRARAAATAFRCRRTPGASTAAAGQEGHSPNGLQFDCQSSPTTRRRASNTQPATDLLTDIIVRPTEHRDRASRTRSSAPCTSRSRERGLPLAGARECPRCRSWFHPYCHYPRYASPSCAVPMDYASSRPRKAAGGTRSPGSPCDMTESRRRHDPSGANQRPHGRQQHHGLAAKRLMVFMSWSCPQHIRTWPAPSPKLPNIGDTRPHVGRVSSRPASEPPGAVSSRAASRPRGESSR